MTITQLAQQSFQASVKGAENIGVLTDMQADPVNLFRVRGGIVLLTQLWGRCTAGVTNACVPVLTFNPDVGALAAIATIMVTMAGVNIGAIVTWDGSRAGAAPDETAALGMAAAGETIMAGNYVILVPGLLYYTNGVVDTTGIMDWYVNYIPALPGASMAAA